MRYRADGEIRIRDWEDDAVIYHPASATTLRISHSLAAALGCLRDQAMDIESLASKLSPEHGQPEAIAAHLREGLEKLRHEGIIGLHG